MSYLIGLDVGGSTTKAVLVSDGEIVHLVRASGSEPLVSAAGAVGKLVEESGVELKKVKTIACTGGGSRCVGSLFLGVRSVKVDELEAVGYGGLLLSRYDEAVVSSVGTGTAIVHAMKKGDRVISRHLGGTGVGGGTLVGLGKLLLDRSTLEGILTLASKGDPSVVNLTVKDIVGGPVGRIPETATASNFGRVMDGVRPEDVAAGLVRMIGEVVATVSYFAARMLSLEDRIVFVGSLPEALGDEILRALRTLGGKGTIPKNSAYAAAIGAASMFLPITS